MGDLKRKIVYCLVLILFLFLGMSFGYIKTRMSSDIHINNVSVLEYAKNYAFNSDNDLVTTASTKTYDIDVVYEDNYTVCKENTTTSKTIYGTTMDKVKEEEKKIQESKGLLYTIKSETDNKIVYTRTINENCPNHFLVILEDKKINIYSIKSEDVKTEFMTLDNINIDNLRKELKNKVEKGTYINSKEDLNKFIEDLES